MRYAILFLFALFLSTCYYDSEEYLFPQQSCDTTGVSYSGTIKPLLESYCYRCHDNSNAPQSGANIRLEDYSDVKIRVDDGSLTGSINHESSFSPMPKGGGKLDNCSLRLFGIWTEDGAPNN
jgi:hypothetical protein